MWKKCGDFEMMLQFSCSWLSCIHVAMYPVHRMKAVEYQFAGLYRGHVTLLQINVPHHTKELFQLLWLYYFAIKKSRREKRELKNIILNIWNIAMIKCIWKRKSLKTAAEKKNGKLAIYLKNTFAWLFVGSQFRLRPLRNRFVNQCILWVYKSEGSYISAAIFKLIQIDCLKILLQEKKMIPFMKIII